ncbi:hypothetical protein KFU94_36210 [Chloroflexi bacterium TSY]|nr:hypothetical protein [Chloroflexi bacterium TSY]
MAVTAYVQPEGTLSTVRGGFPKLLAAARDKDRIHTVVVANEQSLNGLGLVVDQENPKIFWESDASRSFCVLRVETLSEVVALLPEMIKRIEQQPGPGHPPYKGLHYFDVADADLFFGREALTAKLIAALDEQRFLAVVGASGSGKSSLIRAGLVPALQQGRPLETSTAPSDNNRWSIHIITPSAHPLTSLAATLTRDNAAPTATSTLIDELRRGPCTLQRHLHQFVAENPLADRLLLIVDQFEETFTLCRNQADRKAFIDNLLTATLPGSALSVVIALRADFYAHCATFANLRFALEDCQRYIGPMTSDELRSAIVEPARQNEWDFEPGLVEQLLRDVGGGENGQIQQGALPLLSHALLETWKRRRWRTLTFTGYNESGQLQGAIAQTAETVYMKRLNATQQAIARNIFLRLTELGEGTQETRRRVALSELIANPREAQNVEKVLTILADARLITTSQENVEITHEALIREWPTLREWLADDREGLRIHRRLTNTAQEWERLKYDPDILYRGILLEQAAEWAEDHKDELNNLERFFLQVSQRNEEKEQGEKEAAQQKELAQQRILTNRLRWIVSVVVVALLMAVIAGIVIYQQNVALEGRGKSLQAALDKSEDETLRADQKAVEAERQKKIALARQLAAQTLISSDVNRDVELSLLLAIESARASYEADEHILEVYQALRRVIDSAPIAILRKSLWSIEFSPDGSRFATFDDNMVWLMDSTNREQLADDNTVWLMDSTNGEQLALLQHEGGITDVVFNPDGSYLATGSVDYTVRLWKSTSGEKLVLFQHEDVVRSIVFSPDSSYLATVSDDNTVRIWNSTSGEQSALLQHEDRVTGVVFSPDSSRLATFSNDNTSWLVDSVSGEQLARFQHENVVGSVVFSPDGKHVVTQSDNNTILLADSVSGEQLALLQHDSYVADVAFTPDGNRLATGSFDTTARLWDSYSGEQLVLFQHGRSVESVIFSPDGNRLVTKSAYEVKLWNSTSGEPLAFFEAANYDKVIFSPDGSRLVAIGFNRVARLWDTDSGKQLALFRHGGSVTGVDFSPDGSHLVTWGMDNVVRLRDSASGEQLAPLQHENWISDVVFSPDGSYLATASNNNTVRIWDSTSGEQLALLKHKDDFIRIRFSPDGSRLVTSVDDGTTWLWDSASREQPILLQHKNDVRSFSFSPNGNRLATASADFRPNGNRLATASADNTVRIWDSTSGEQLAFGQHAGLIYEVEFSSDGSYLATASADNTVRLWHSTTGEQLALLQHEDDVKYVRFSPNGSYLATVSVDNTVRLWHSGRGRQPVLIQHMDLIYKEEFSSDSSRLTTTNFGSTESRVIDVKSDRASRYNFPSGADHISPVLEIHCDSIQCQPNEILLNPNLYIVSQKSVIPHFSEQRHDATFLDKYNNTMRLSDDVSRKQKASLPDEDRIIGVDFSPDGSRLVIWDNTNTVWLWDGVSGKQIALLQHEDRLWSVRFSPDGGRLSTSSYDNTVRLWDSISGEELILIQSDPSIKRVVLSPDGNRLATSSNDNTVRLWDTVSKEQLAIFPYQGGGSFIEFSPDGSRLIISNNDNIARLIDSASSKHLAFLQHEYPVNAIVFSRDSSRIIIASGGTTVQLWDSISGNQLAFFPTADRSSDVAFSPNGSQIAISDSYPRQTNHTVYLWGDLWLQSMKKLVATACRIVSRDLSEKEWSIYMPSTETYRSTCSDLPWIESTTLMPTTSPTLSKPTALGTPVPRYCWYLKISSQNATKSAN